MYFYRQSLYVHFQSIHSYPSLNSRPNSASRRARRICPTKCTYHPPAQSLNTLRRTRASLHRESVPATCTYSPGRSFGVRAREFRLKRSRGSKHVSLRRRRRGSGPRGNVVVERRSVIKHISHISHLRRVPIPNVLVERRSGIKHSSHMSHFLCVPTPNVSVERRSGYKHTLHSSHLRCVPTSNVLVERRSSIKHRSHITHLLLCSNSPMSWLNAEA